MLLKDIQIGGRYRAKVSGKLQTVRVLERREKFQRRGMCGGVWRTTFIAVNEATGKTILIKSVQRLREAVQ